MNILLFSLIILGAVGFLCGIALAIASRMFAVKIDPRIEVLENILPGGQCGGCGFPSCHAYAQNILESGAPPNRCVLGANIVDEISKILGKEVATVERKTAVIQCLGADTAVKLYEYGGIASCRAASLYSSGDNLWTYSCLGFGDCVEVCPFGALSIASRGTPVVDREECTGCGKCITACPKHAITLIPQQARVYIGCNSKDKGKEVRKICEVGCLKCRRCIKVCPEDALSMQDNQVNIDYSKCTNCGLCIEECPSKIIVDIHC
jgi:electron transport complex protein RnfB